MKEEYMKWICANALEVGLQERPDQVSDTELMPLVIELCDCYQDMKNEQNNQSELYKPGTEWKEYIAQRSGVYQTWSNKNYGECINIFRNFWRGALSPIVKQYATYEQLIGNDDLKQFFIDSMAYDFMVWSNLYCSNMSELTIKPVGNPWGYVINEHLIAPKALRYHALKTQVMQILADIEQPTIVEIGGGYGGLAYYLLNNNKAMTYINFDLPETLLLMAYYLKRTVPERKMLIYEKGMSLDSQIIQDHEIILLPNWLLPSLPEHSVDIFINTFSFSEIPRDTLAEYIHQVERACRGYFLHNNMDREGVENLGYKRTPCSMYPISEYKFKMLYKRYDLFQRKHYGRDGDYREVLYQRIW